VSRKTIINALFHSTTSSVVQYLVIVGLVVYASLQGASAMGYNWQWYRIPQYFYQFTNEGFVIGEIPVGLLGTLKLSLIAFFLALVVGLIIALLRLSDLIVGSMVAMAFLEVIRNTPLLVLLYLFYYVLGPIFNLDRYYASVLCLAVFHSALISEIFRAGINSVDKGQWEAAKTIGMTKYQAYRYIVIPQSVRFMLPPMTGEAVHLIKSTAIVSVIAVAELTTVGRNIIAETYMSFEIWFTVAIVYLVISLILSMFVSHLEKTYSRSL
jgi:polar amino acid transport system permease protein